MTSLSKVDPFLGLPSEARVNFLKHKLDDMIPCRNPFSLKALGM